MPTIPRTPASGGLSPVSPMSPPAPWLGGKRHLAARIVERIHAMRHAVYAEPFLGMGGVFFRRRLRPRVEVINDLNRDVATFFRVLQRHERALLDEMLAWQLASRAEFERLCAIDPATLTDLERAARFYCVQRLAFSGKAVHRSFGVSPGGASRLNVRILRRRLESLHARLAGVIIECLPFDQFLTLYDRQDALFYLDPPYSGGEADYGKGMFRPEDFARLAGMLAGLSGQFILSINDVPAMRTAFAAFPFEAVTTTYTAGDSERDRSQAMAELIVFSPPRPGEGAPRQVSLF